MLRDSSVLAGKRGSAGWGSRSPLRPPAPRPNEGRRRTSSAEGGRVAGAYRGRKATRREWLLESQGEGERERRRRPRLERSTARPVEHPNPGGRSSSSSSLRCPGSLRELAPGRERSAIGTRRPRALRKPHCGVPSEAGVPPEPAGEVPGPLPGGVRARAGGKARLGAGLLRLARSRHRARFRADTPAFGQRRASRFKPIRATAARSL